MGQISSLKRSEYLQNYKKVLESSDEYFGRVEIMESIYSREQIIHKTIHLNTNDDVIDFERSFRDQSKTAFHVIYPFDIEKADEEGLCSKTDKVHVFFKNKPPMLCEKMKN